MSPHTLRVSVAILLTAAAAALTACAPPRAAATATTAGDVAAPAAAESAPQRDPSATLAGADSAAETPAGQLACKAKSALDGTTELFLEWHGNTAKGTLRRTTPSGNVDLQPVQAERSSGLIVVDAAGEADLVAHAAVIRQEGGKSLMRLGGSGRAWASCE